jgi:hypothetical protein
MATTSRTRPGRALVGAVVLLAGFALLATGCQRYAAQELDDDQRALDMALVCEPVVAVAERPEGLLDEVVVTAPVPGWPLYLAGDVPATPPSVQ